MSERQWKRLDAVAAVEQGILSNVGAAARLGLSARQLRRVRRRVAELGRAGVVHGNTGRAPKHRLSAEQRERIVELRLGQYRGFNDQHFTDKLGEVEQLEVSRGGGRRADATAPAARAPAAARTQAGGGHDAVVGWQHASVVGAARTATLPDGRVGRRHQRVAAGRAFCRP